MGKFLMCVVWALGWSWAIGRFISLNGHAFSVPFFGWGITWVMIVAAGFFWMGAKIVKLV